MGDELSPLAYPWRSSLARELDVGSCPGFSVHTGINADGSVRFAFPDSNLEISARRWTYHRGEEEACFSTATLLGAKVRLSQVLLYNTCILCFSWKKSISLSRLTSSLMLVLEFGSRAISTTAALRTTNGHLQHMFPHLLHITAL